MKIKSATFQNYRGITNLSLEFSPKTTVLAGVNGVGKSAVLDGLAALFADDWNLDLVGTDDIRAGFDELTLEVYGSDRRRTISLTRGTNLREQVSTPDDLAIPTDEGLFAHYNSKRSAFDSPINTTSVEKTEKLHSKRDVDFASFFAWFKD